jgi:hypothetical protein
MCAYRQDEPKKKKKVSGFMSILGRAIPVGARILFFRPVDASELEYSCFDSFCRYGRVLARVTQGACLGAQAVLVVPQLSATREEERQQNAHPSARFEGDFRAT